MNRRTFLRLMSNLSLFVFTPMRSLLPSSHSPASGKATQTGEVLSVEQAEALRTIHTLETRLQQQRGRFSWELYNDLRHTYRTIDEAKSLEYTNAILAHSIMDSYILNTLSNWHDEPSYRPTNPQLAVESLLYHTEGFPNLKCVQVACLIKAGDICATNQQSELAQQLYQRALDNAGWKGIKALQSYRSLAQSKLARYEK